MSITTCLVAGTTTPTHASGAMHFTADITLNGFGIGSSSGSADLCVDRVDGTPIVTAATCSSLTGHGGANAHATFTLYEDPELCPLIGRAEGSVTGVVSGDFTWIRVGTVAWIGGDFTGSAHFVVTSPLGDACGTTGTVKASAEGDVSRV